MSNCCNNSGWKPECSCCKNFQRPQKELRPQCCCECSEKHYFKPCCFEEKKCECCKCCECFNRPYFEKNNFECQNNNSCYSNQNIKY